MVTISGQVTSVSDEISSQVTVYPNPASKILNIVSSAVAIQGISLYNTIGTEVYTQSGSSAISVGGLAKGVYFLKIMTSKGIAVKTISIQ